MSLADKLGIGPTRTEEQIRGGWRITVTPPKWSGINTSASIVLNDNQYRRYQMWLNTDDYIQIQEIFPDLTPAEREILMTGIKS